MPKKHPYVSKCFGFFTKCPLSNSAYSMKGSNDLELTHGAT